MRKTTVLALALAAVGLPMLLAGCEALWWDTAQANPKPDPQAQAETIELTPEESALIAQEGQVEAMNDGTLRTVLVARDTEIQTGSFEIDFPAGSDGRCEVIVKILKIGVKIVVFEDVNGNRRFDPGVDNIVSEELRTARGVPRFTDHECQLLP